MSSMASVRRPSSDSLVRRSSWSARLDVRVFFASIAESIFRSCGLLLPVQPGVVGFEGRVSVPVGAVLDGRGLDRVEEQRRRHELVEDEDHGPDEEDDELHRDLEDAVGQEPLAAFGDRPSGQIALDLRLVRPEIGQGDEAPADEARPEVVAVLPVEGEIDDVQLPELSGHVDGVREGDVGRAGAGRSCRTPPPSPR